MAGARWPAYSEIRDGAGAVLQGGAQAFISALPGRLRHQEGPEERLMRRALRWAQRAAEAGEVPVGALLVQGPLDLPRPKHHRGGAQPRRSSSPDPTAHAERLVLERAARKLGRWRLNDCTLVVTLEPCAMCAGAFSMGQARAHHLWSARPQGPAPAVPCCKWPITPS